MVEEFYLCKWCLYDNNTPFCDAERCTTIDEHPDNECDRYVEDEMV